MSIFDIQSQDIILPDSTNSPLGAIQHFKELTAGAGSNVFKVNSEGMFLGATKFASAPFRVNYSGAVTASNVTITGGTISGAVVSGLGSGSLLNIQGWSFSGVFSATDSDTVAWTAGTITLGDGTTFSISAGNTGNISALTYIYLDTAVSTTVLQTTTTSGTAVGANKIMVAVAKNETGKNATFQAFGGKGVGQLITSANIASNTITSNEIASNTIVSNNITTSALTGLLIQASTFQTASSAPNFKIFDSDMRYYTGSAYPFFVCFKDDSGLGDAGDVGIGDTSGNYMFWDQSAGTIFIRGEVETNSSSYRIVLQPSQRRIALYDGSTLRGSIYTDSDGDMKLDSTDDMVFKIPSSKQFRFQINSGNEHIIDGDGDLIPGSNNTNKVGSSTVSYAQMNAYSFVDHCLWLDELDDLEILKATAPQKDSNGEIKRDKDGNAKLDPYSLPSWMHNRQSIEEDIARKKEIISKKIDDIKKIKAKDDKTLKEVDSQTKILEEEYSNYNLTEEEIVERTGRNMGHFLDLVAGAVRQLDRKVENLISLNNLKCDS